MSPQGFAGAEALEVEAWKVLWGLEVPRALCVSCGVGTVWEPDVSRLFGVEALTVSKLRHPRLAAQRGSEKARKLVQVGRLTPRGEIARLLIANALEANGGREHRACVVRATAENVMSVCFRVSREQRSGDHLEEHQTR
jgi:hypothetical protein